MTRDELLSYIIKEGCRRLGVYNAERVFEKIEQVPVEDGENRVAFKVYARCYPSGELIDTVSSMTSTGRRRIADILQEPAE